MVISNTCILACILKNHFSNGNTFRYSFNVGFKLSKILTTSRISKRRRFSLDSKFSSLFNLLNKR